MKKKNIAVISSVVALIAVATVGVTLARGSAESKNNTEHISEYALSVSAAPDKTEKTAGKVTPGGELVSPYAVINDQDGNAYDVYVRASVYHYFETKDDRELSSAVADLYVMVDGEKVLLPTDIASYEDQNADLLADWIIAYSDDEQVVMYYKHPVKQNEVTSNFLDGVSFSPEMDNEYKDCSYKVEAEINAVQVNAGEAAIASELGVYVTLDEDGNIVKVSEEKEAE